MVKEYVTLQQIAKKTGYTRSALSYWIKQGQFKKGTVYRMGNTIVVKKKEAERIIKEKLALVAIN